MTSALTEQPTGQQRRAMRDAVLTACLGSLAVVAFTNGLLLLLLTTLGFSSERIVVYLSLPQIAGALLVVPFAVLSDRYGKKRLGVVGIVGAIAGYALLSASLWTGGARNGVVAGALVLYAVSNTLHSSSWFALLSPIVPESQRGRFFGRMRMAWQLLNVAFSGGCAFMLSQETPLPVFAALMTAITVMLVIHLGAYMRVPEIEPVSKSEPMHVRRALGHIFRTEGFMSFSAYMFLLSLATASAPILFGLIEKRILGYGDDLVVWLGNLYMVGAVSGFAAGGRMVDRFGTKPVFLIGHFGYAAVLVLFLARSFFPSVVGVAFVPVATAHFAYGFLWAYVSIAATTEMLALIPDSYKSLSTSVCNTFIRIGASLSGVLVAWLLKLGVLAETWTLRGVALSRYDTVLLFCAAGITLLVVTLGLVPSIIHKAEWVPRQY